MKKKLIIYNVILTLIVLALMLGVGLAVTDSNYKEMTERKIREITDIYAENYSEDLSLPSGGDIRVTIVSATGVVLKDSSRQDVSDMENHIDREEIIAALNGEPRVVERESETLGTSMMYYAEKVTVSESADGYVFIRVAVPVESSRSYILKSLVPMISILVVVWAGGTIASVLLSGVLLKPLQQVKEGLAGIERGTYKEIPPTTGDEDLNVILSGINDLGSRLQTSMAEARGEKQKLDYVLNNVSDGIAVFDVGLNVLIANPRIYEIFGVKNVKGKHIEVLTADKTFISEVSDCATGKAGGIFQFETDGRYYMCTVRYTDSDMIIAVISDVTESKNREKMRLEFFANASHELKTPLTSVKGFNDLISMQSTDERIVEYSRRADKEINRVLNLINDMLGLSRLENSGLSPERLTAVRLEEVAGEVAENLKLLSDEKEVSVTVSGKGEIQAEREHIYELIKNLAENGIRYNKKGGRVKIEIAEGKDGVTLKVQDNGMGIETQDQSRIFERFYRGSKSRSRETGGTGLGLSIVKHVCELYGAELTLKSKLGAGTVISVVFPRDKDA